MNPALVDTADEGRAFKLGAAIGAMVLISAGAAWAFAALANRVVAPPIWAYGVVAVSVTMLIAWGAIRVAAIVRMPVQRVSEASAVEGARRGRKTGLMFGAIVSVEVALIAGVAVFLARADRGLLVPVAVVAIVGLHFVPLSRVFRVSTYGIAGWLLTSLAALSMLIADERARVFDLAIAVALVLWASAARVLVLHTGSTHGRTSTAPIRNADHDVS
ncbi:MAG: hypothetical protein ABJE10_08160 [bacterium]